MTLQRTQELCSRKDDGFEKGVELIFQWVAIFSTIGEWFIILLQELLKTFPKKVSQQKLQIRQLESCLALPFHSDSISEEGFLDGTQDDFTVLDISPDNFDSWLSECKKAAGIEEECTLPIVVNAPRDVVVTDNIVSPTSDLTGLLPSPKRVKPPYIPNPNPRKRPQKRVLSSDKGFG